MIKNQTSSLGTLQAAVDIACKEFEKKGTLKRIWEKDAALWKNEPQHQKVIQNRLGWLDSVNWLLEKKGDLTKFGQDVSRSGFRHAVLLGMGGSSLAPEVFCRTFERTANYPELIILDSTDPDQVLGVEREIDLAKTLFIVSTKSGTTLETLSFFHYFFEKMKQKKGNQAGESFVAITDSGTPLEKSAQELSFRRAFINPQNIGGRFSVLSYFGMVPLAAMGAHVGKMIDRIKAEVDASRGNKTSEPSAGALLGIAMAEAVKKGRDKLTIFMSPEIHSYGLWIEQLLAESLGKEGKGIIPIFGEPLESPDAYRGDRLFVYLSCGKKDAEMEKKLEALVSKDHPVIRISLEDSYDLGRQFYRWALATAVTGAELGINPFDEPNVQEAKTWTNLLLEELKKHGKFPEPDIHIKENNFYGTFGKSAVSKMDRPPELSSFLKLLEACDYISLSAYIPYDPEAEKILIRLRLKLRSATKAATMFGFGPRYLHSTGQLHKGGPNSCLMILMTADTKGDAPIPGQSFSFRELEYAQAVGDFQALDAKERRVVRFHLKQPIAKVLCEIEQFFNEAL